MEIVYNTLIKNLPLEEKKQTTHYDITSVAVVFNRDVSMEDIQIFEDEVWIYTTIDCTSLRYVNRTLPLAAADWIKLLPFLRTCRIPSLEFKILFQGFE